MLASPVTSGTPTLASQFNNLRLDALALTETVTAGEVYAATTLVTAAGVNQGYSLPTLLYESGGQWFRMPGNTTNGARMRVAMAYEASGSIGASVRIYMPGSLVPITVGTPATADYGRNVSNSNTLGACELTVRPNFYTHIGFLINASYFLFQGPIYNNVFSKSIETPITAGEAFSALDLLYVKVSDGKAYKANATALESGYCRTPLIAAQAATGADQIVLAHTPGAVIRGYALTPGATYYPSATPGGYSTTKVGYHRPIGYAIDSTTLVFFPGKENDNTILEVVNAGENWSIRELLYFKKSDQLFYKADADIAESGILEIPAIAFNTHASGAGSAQLVYMPGSVIRNAGFTFTAGDRLFPSGTPGAYVANSPASLDTFFRNPANALAADIISFLPKQMEFLPTGMQEKGYVAAGEYAQVGQLVNMSVGVNFKNVMVNVPSSITLTSTATQYAGTPTANNITRFGFRFYFPELSNPGNQQSWWAGTYQTVGN